MKVEAAADRQAAELIKERAGNAGMSLKQVGWWGVWGGNAGMSLKQVGWWCVWGGMQGCPSSRWVVCVWGECRGFPQAGGGWRGSQWPNAEVSLTQAVEGGGGGVRGGRGKG